MQCSTFTPCSNTLLKTIVSKHDFTIVQYYTVLFSYTSRVIYNYPLYLYRTVQLPLVSVQCSTTTPCICKLLYNYSLHLKITVQLPLVSVKYCTTGLRICTLLCNYPLYLYSTLQLPLVAVLY